MGNLLTSCLLLLPLCAAASINVTSFGAVGDAVQVYVGTTSNSVVVVTTNSTSAEDIGKTIQLLDCGPVTSAPNCQDLIATITNVGANSLYIDALPQRSLTETFCAYGTDNRVAFSNAIAAHIGGSTNITIPAGKYLFTTANVPNAFGTIYAALALYKGGLNFIGEGTNETVLLSQGAWTLKSGVAVRGMLFALGCPITNDYPVSFQDLTLDGGVPNGNTSDHSFPASVTTGDGWDVTHDALEIFGGGGIMWSSVLFTNVLVQHWRGEMFKSTDGSTNGNLRAVNCVFYDGNATALNIYAALTITNCHFERLHEVAEYYQRFSTNTSLFANNTVTNMTGALFAINGAWSNQVNQPFVIRSNTFYMVDQNGIQTTPAQNVTIQGNRFLGVSASGGNPIVLGAAGYQGTTMNSNILVAENLFSNVFYAVAVYGAGGNAVKDVTVSRNTGLSAFRFGVNTGLATNVNFVANISNGRGLDSSSASGQYLFDSGNSFTPAPINDAVGITNTVSYKLGSSHQVATAHASSKFLIDSDSPLKVPSASVIYLTNSSGISITAWPNSLEQSGVGIGNNSAALFYWNGYGWATSQWNLARGMRAGNLRVMQ